MANLATTDKPIPSRRQQTQNRDALLPTRRNTNAPELEVNTRLRRPDSGGADELRRILNLAEETGEAFLARGERRQAKRDEEAAAAGALDAATGERDEERAAKSRAYRTAYAREGALATATDWDLKVTTAVQDRLANEDDPATLDDIAELIEQSARDLAVDPDTGKVMDFGDPRAAATIATAIGKTRARLLNGAVDVIKARADAKLVGTVAFNVVNEALSAAAVTPVEVPPSNSAPAPAGAAPPVPSGPAPKSSWKVISRPGAPRDGGKRVHAGYDIAPADGNPGWHPAQDFRIERPRHGGKRAGLTADVILADGTRLKLMHLAELPKAGSYKAGQLAAIAGHTGNAKNTPAHFHTEAADGSDPSRHFGIGTGGPGEGVDAYAGSTFTGKLAEKGADEQPRQPLPRIDFEVAMARVPPTVSRADAKKGLMEAFFIAADERGDASILDNLWHSTRPDGTPSFTPDEISKIRAERDRIRENIRVRAKRAESDRFAANEDAVLAQFVEGRPLSIAEVRRLAAQGHIQPRFAFSLIQQEEADQRQDQRELRAEQRDAEREAEAETAYTVVTEAEALRSGAVTGVSEETLRQRLDRGEFGSGKKALAHYRSLTAALRTGRQVAAQSPEAAAVAERWELRKPKQGGTLIERVRAGASITPEAHAAGAALIRQRLREGVTPEAAYHEAEEKYGKPQKPQDRAQRIRELRARQGR